jgi:prepilin-type N-terminal cleavage/methylation domain-containing protein
MSSPALDPRQDGFSLVEVLMSVIILGVILISLAGLTFQTAQRSVKLADTNMRQAALLQEVNRLTAVWPDDLNSFSGCNAIMIGTHEMQRCVDVDTMTLRPHAVRVTVRMFSPLEEHRPDSVSFVRSRPGYVNPLNSPGS